ncbi:hypothetical protein APSETT444_004837 [Aspergillus pseudonomiae]
MSKALEAALKVTRLATEAFKESKPHLEDLDARDYVVTMRDANPSQVRYHVIADRNMRHVYHEMQNLGALGSNGVTAILFPPKMIKVSTAEKRGQENWSDDDDGDGNGDDNRDDDGDEDYGDYGDKSYAGENAGDMWLKLADVLFTTLVAWNGGEIFL